MFKKTFKILLVSILCLIVISVIVAKIVQTRSIALPTHDTSSESIDLTKNSSTSPSDTSISPSVVTTSGQLYTNKDFGFSFIQPAGYTVGSFDQGDSTVILVQDANKKNGVQILVSPFDEDIVLSTDRIKKDLPNITLNEVGSVRVGNAVIAVSFTSNFSTFGVPSRNVWFVYKKHLYQISAPTVSRDTLLTLVSTWRVL